MLLQHKHVEPISILEECGKCHVKDIDPRLISNSSAIKIGQKWYHQEKNRPCDRLYREQEAGK